MGGNLRRELVDAFAMMTSPALPQPASIAHEFLSAGELHPHILYPYSLAVALLPPLNCSPKNKDAAECPSWPREPPCKPVTCIFQEDVLDGVEEPQARHRFCEAISIRLTETKGGKLYIGVRFPV